MKKSLSSLFLLVCSFSVIAAWYKTCVSAISSLPLAGTNNQNQTEGMSQKSSFQAQHPSPPLQENDKADIYLNFENVSLATIVNYLSEQRKINIIPHKDLNNFQVSIVTREPLTLARAWNVLLTLLDVNNFALINIDDLYRVIALQLASKEPLPVYSSTTGTTPDHLPETDKIIRYIHFFRNATAQDMQRVLSSMLSPNSVQINQDLQACIITDTCIKIKSAMKIVTQLDQGGLRQSLQIIPLTYVNAQRIALLFQDIIGQQAQKVQIFSSPESEKDISYFSPSTKIIPEPIKNSIILLGAKEHMDRITDFIKRYIDVPPDKAESRLHIKEIKYMSAEKLKPLLDSVIRAPAGQKQSKSPVIGEFKYFEDVIIAAETNYKDDLTRGSGNRLIVACNQDDWKRLESFIDKIDKPLPQVAMEVMIVDISSALQRQIGTHLRNKPGILGKSLNVETMHLATDNSGITPLDQRNLINIATNDNETATHITLGNAESNGVWGDIKMLLLSQNADIISQPFLVTNSGEASEMEVTTNIRVPGKINDPSKTGGSRTQDQEDMPSMTKVVLTPRINSDGIVNLAININISEFQQTITGAQPKTSDRALQTQVMLGIGQILVLGGLSQSRLADTLYKTPILADIPILGNLFKSKRKSSDKTSLHVFVRPTVIKPVFEGRPDEYTALKIDYAKHQILEADPYYKAKDPIQRWFFKPRRESTEMRLSDNAKGKFRLIDDFAEGKYMPRSVDIARDPFYETRDSIKRLNQEHKLAALKRRKKYQQAPSPAHSDNLQALYSHVTKS